MKIVKTFITGVKKIALTQRETVRFDRDVKSLLDEAQRLHEEADASLGDGNEVRAMIARKMAHEFESHAKLVEHVDRHLKNR